MLLNLFRQPYKAIRYIIKIIPARAGRSEEMWEISGLSQILSSSRIKFTYLYYIQLILNFWGTFCCIEFPETFLKTSWELPERIPYLGVSHAWVMCTLPLYALYSDFYPLYSVLFIGLFIGLYCCTLCMYIYIYVHKQRERERPLAL